MDNGCFQDRNHKDTRKIQNLSCRLAVNSTLSGQSRLPVHDRRMIIDGQGYPCRLASKQQHLPEQRRTKFSNTQQNAPPQFPEAPGIPVYSFPPRGRTVS